MDGSLVALGVVAAFLGESNVIGVYLKLDPGFTTSAGGSFAVVVSSFFSSSVVASVVEASTGVVSFVGSEVTVSMEVLVVASVVLLTDVSSCFFSVVVAVDFKSVSEL